MSLRNSGHEDDEQWVPWEENSVKKSQQTRAVPQVLTKASACRACHQHNRIVSAEVQRAIRSICCGGGGAGSRLGVRQVAQLPRTASQPLRGQIPIHVRLPPFRRLIYLQTTILSFTDGSQDPPRELHDYLWSLQSRFFSIRSCSSD